MPSEPPVPPRRAQPGRLSMRCEAGGLRVGRGAARRGWTEHWRNPVEIPSDGQLRLGIVVVF